MGYKLVILDIDGTIRNAKQGPTKRVRKVLSRIKLSGAIVTLATGRMFKAAIEATIGLNISCPIISSQGAHIADPGTGKTLWHQPLTPTMSLKALDALEDWTGELLAYSEELAYASSKTPWVEGYSRRQRGRMKIVSDLRAVAKNGLTRLVAVGDEDKISILSKKLSAFFGSELNIVPSLPQFCEILHPAASKNRALKWLCHHLGIRQCQTIAFANGREDIDMLCWAGLGVAVQNGATELLLKADRIAPSEEEDGVAQVLEEMLDCGMIG